MREYVVGNPKAKQFIEVVQNHFHVGDPTRRYSIIDLVLCNKENTVSNLKVGIKFNNFYHEEISFSIKWKGNSN